MDRTTKIVFGVVVGLLLLFLLVAGCSVFLFYTLVDSTKDVMQFVEECPLPNELSFVNNSNPTEEDVMKSVEWCCTNYDSSREICQLLEQQRTLNSMQNN
ncbi:hypothetical protein HYV86_06680 [Candidatus Woesearchaeota archaeon]|nr:hypothetical protein [Candidatus Woesearchaeota archaeon]